MFLFLALAAAIVALLAAYATYLHYRLYRRQQQVDKFNAEQQALAQKNIARIHSDVNFLLSAYLDKQIELAELSLRINHLLDCLSLDSRARDAYAIFDEIAGQIKHIPTHEDWKKLSKQERRKHEANFAKLEQQYSDVAREAAKKLSLAKAIH
ncbi:DUF2489 domain-containing protein [Agaribacterium haliotis]|uniref:DUF2489 domain-containing protein n=1 Tax=Agaribacterium haliotis TaxID=2013869 RepID=UPI00130440EA|nr:DUF2489 domain-containing protein [Agaribacterium haliotis]